MLPTPRAICNNHIRGTRLRVVWMLPLVVDGSNSHGIDAIGVTVEVALVSTRSTITRGEDEDEAFSLPPIVDPIDNGLLDEITRTLHGQPIVWWAPAATVDGNVVETIVEGCSFVDVGDRTRKDAYAGHL